MNGLILIIFGITISLLINSILTNIKLEKHLSFHNEELKRTLVTKDKLVDTLSGFETHLEGLNNISKNIKEATEILERRNKELKGKYND